MVNSTRSSHRAKDEENNNARVMQNGEKGKIKSHPNVSNTAGLRRSPRETPSKKISPRGLSTSSTCKSGRPVKRAPLPPAVNRKAERVKKKMPSPLRRSGRTRSHSSASPSDSKSSGSLCSNPKPKKEKSVRQLSFEAKEVNETEEHDLGTPQLKTKRMNVHTYRGFFSHLKESNNLLSSFILTSTETNRINESNQSGNNDGGKVHECSKGSHSVCKEVSKNGALSSKDSKSKEMRADSGLSEPVKDPVENTMTRGSLAPANATTSGAGLAPESIQLDYCREETLKMLVSSNFILDENLIRNSIGDDKGEKSIPSTRKETTVDADSDGSATLAKDDNCKLNPDGSLLGLGGNTVGIDRPSSAAIYETGMVPERVQPDGCREETLKMLPSRNFIVDEDLIRNSVKHDSSGEKFIPSKRKGITVDMESEGSVTLAKGDNCNLIPDGMGTGEPCSKRMRLEYNATVRESCNPSATELQGGEYINASLLQEDTQIDNENEVGIIANSNIQPKEVLSSHIADGCKFDSFRFVEYWAPVQLSNVQLEQYCDILLSNASILRSSSKVDSGEALRDVLTSIRKCCSLPYLVDPKLKDSLRKGLEPIEYLDFEIKSSGKVHLLDSMLKELRKNASRVLILFQSIGGYGKISIGDYLDDLLLQRFGSDSYERIDKCLSASQKQAAMKKFNEKNNRRFVFLLETSACLPSIKLSSVDTIIIFDSELNPMNDIRSLQKIKLDSQFELIKIFRLYSSFTVEEKALILAKQYKTLDIHLQNINWSTSHMLLMWGASCLFDELKVFHDGETSSSNVKSLFEQSLFPEVMHEFSSILSWDGEHIDSSNCSKLFKVQQNGLMNSANFSMLGELKCRALDEDSPQFFWTKLLEGKHFRWKYLNSSCLRSRKKVHHFDGSVKGPDLLSEGGATKKRRKVSNNIVDQSSKAENEKLSTGIKSDRFQGNNVEAEQKSRQHDEQRSLHLLLKPEITKLCHVFHLPDNVRSMVYNFLEYVMNNHHVNREPLRILQAFQISLCWTVASLLKHKLDHKTSIEDAERDLNFKCKKEEVDYIYSMLRCLKKIFLYRTRNNNDTGSPKVAEPLNRQYSCPGVAREIELFKKDMSRSIKEIRKKCAKYLNKLQLSQGEEKQRLRAAIDDENAKVEGSFKIQSAFIRSCSPNDVLRMERLKLLNIEYEKEIAELKCRHETCLRDLENKQLAELRKFQDREAIWVEDVKSWAENELLNIVASKEHGTGVESLQSCDQVQPHNVLKNHFAEEKGRHDRVEAITETVTENSPLSDKRIANRATLSLLDREELLGPHGIVNVIDCPENSIAVNPPSFVKQKSDRRQVNEFSDRELGPSNGPDNDNLLRPQHDGVSSSMLNGVPLVEKSSISDQLEGTSKAMTELSQETPVSTSLNVMNPPEHVQQLSVEISPDHREMQHSSEQPVLISSAVDVVPVNQSNHVSLIEKPIEQVQQLPSTELPFLLNSTNFPLVTEVEHRPIVVPNQDEQSQSNLVLDSHSHEVVVHPTSNPNPDTVTPNEVRMQSSDTLNLSTPAAINYQHMQVEIHSASRMQQHLSCDPLKNELDRIRSITEQTMKYYEDMKLRLKTDFEKELEELQRKYDSKFQGIEVEYKQTKTTLDTHLNVVQMNKFLADAFRSKCSTLKTSSSSAMLQDSNSAHQQLLEPSRQQRARLLSHVAGSSSCGPSVTSLQSPSTTASPQHMVRRHSIVNNISLPVGNIQAGGVIRAPPPHLQPYRP
ncbi:hypothetical protein Fmac_019605 [Flemingia macrophylla]|uniref:Helicase C-terminal domain-containing protein n=1 Tax=Flemingia macrophylla TaxID=520843 RepID=A0ABD1M8C2_9FABA